jgi:chemosensory pili system protein ChpA (sensor histidine kinase/response regulator)
MSILIVDDDEGVQQFLADVLALHGYVVEQARDGQQALEMLEHGSRPSLILLDLAMPKMDGVELARRLAADTRLARLPVVLISARPNIERTARDIGAADFLRKPMSFSALLEVIEARQLH